MKKQLGRIFAWSSQGVNCILLKGHHDMTVSARAYLGRDKKRKWRIFSKIINKVFFWQEDHCKQSFMADVEFAREVLSRTDSH